MPSPLLLRLALLAALFASSSVRADDNVDYAKQIKPVLHERCYACHGALKQEGGLRLDTAALAIQGGDSGAALVPGNAAESVLLQRVSARDESERMPPEGEPLTPAQIEALRRWIEQKAPAPADEQPEADPRRHWAFQSPVRPPVPVVRNEAWRRNPSDAFLAAEHERHGLTPQAPADRLGWLRRVTLDLTGLPPSRAEMEAFRADDSAEAYDRVVDRLLASPQYGERWGRHWMDIWRYSDWWGLGAEVRNSQKHIWHWRDWIIESLNADVGYDQMLREMLAADELYPDDLDRLRAGGFLARQYFKFNRTTWLDGVVEHTAKAMLGLTANCAKCHDHKYDPLSQQEYYQLRAFFEPYQIRTDFVPGQTTVEKDGIPRPFDCNLDQKTYLHVRGDESKPDEGRVIVPGVPSFLPQETLRIESIALPPVATRPGLRAFVVEAHRAAADKAIAAARTELESARRRLQESELAAANVPAKEEPPSAEPKTLIEDRFTADRPDLREPRSGVWKQESDRLVQTQTGATRAALRWKIAPPRDFEARLRYIPRGGETWKSVGIAFDVAGPEQEVLAYLSSYAGGPKAQVSYRAGGGPVYPAEGAQGRPIPLDEPHELVLRVRDTLINLTVDGQESVAYRLPIPRQDGPLELIAFDARAEFLSFELRTLPMGVPLREPAAKGSAKGKPTGPLPVDQAQLAVMIAEKALLATEAERASVDARAAADVARFPATGSVDAGPAIRAAVEAERRAAIARADEAVSRAELALVQAPTEEAGKAKREEAEKGLAKAKEALDAARKALETPGVAYAELAGAYKTLESNVETEESRSKPFPTTSSGRRAALARWMTDPRHPLTPRVAVNHIWSRHMGRPLVATVFDFGRKGAAPTHPELLDWLAVEFVESGWSMKHLHRLIVTSQAYRLSSSSVGAEAANRVADAENRYYWRGNPIRMEAQVVRDSLLSLAGELDLTRGGPSIPVKEESRRRSLYYVHSHNEHQTFLSIFDDANVLDCYRRAESIVPQQALALENSEVALAMAERIADRIAKEGCAEADDEFVREAFLVTLNIEPSDDERTLLRAALVQLTATSREQKRPMPERQARVSLVHALLNHNDFVTIR